MVRFLFTEVVAGLLIQQLRLNLPAPSPPDSRHFNFGRKENSLKAKPFLTVAGTTVEDVVSLLCFFSVGT